MHLGLSKSAYPDETLGVYSEGLQTAGSVLRDVERLLLFSRRNATGFGVFGFEIVGVCYELLDVWHRMVDVGTGC